MLGKSQIKYIQSLAHKKHREEEKLFVAEGPKIVKELLMSGAIRVKRIFAIKQFLEELNGRSKEAEEVEITGEELARISQLTTPNQVLAVVEQPPLLTAMDSRDKITLVLDTIQDPGNLGTIIRIADWFGISQIILSENCADIYNHKVVQATMGSIARVKFLYTNIGNWLNEQEVAVYAAMLEGEDVSEMKKIKEGIIIIGNESRGIDPLISTVAVHKVTIPRKGAAESLNAAVATGIILSHLT
jgi:RNA methyltransferase, TrmH family